MDKRKGLLYYTVFIKGVVAYICFLILSGMAWITMPFLTEATATAFDRALIPIAYLSYSLMIFVAYRVLASAFYLLYDESETYPNKTKTAEAFLLLIKRPLFWLGVLPKLVPLVLMPLSASFFPVLLFFESVGMPKDSFIISALLRLFIGVFVLWAEVKNRKQIITRHGKKRVGGFGGRLIAAVASYTVVPIILNYVIYFFYCAIKTLSDPQNWLTLIFVIITIALVVSLFSSVKYLRCVLIRRKFFKRLKKTCLSMGAEIDELYRPYLSVFSIGDKPTFVLKYKGKKVICQMISIPNRADLVLFSEKGTVTRRHTFLFARLLLRRILALAERFFSYTTVLDYNFDNTDPNSKKVLIVSPVPKEMYTGTLAKNVLIDVGEKVGEYTIYNGTGFINAIERDIIYR